MTKQKTTKRSLVLSALALFVCIAMFIGSTFAWFTDSVTSAGNVIQSGTLDVDLVDADGNSLAGKVIEFKTADGRDQENILWEPGCTYETEPVYVKNNGNLALKYKMGINGIIGDAKLLEAIEWTVTIGDVKYKLSALEGKLYPEAGKNISEAIVLSGHMKEEAGNEYQGLTAEGISITVFATQLTSEFDSFNDQYDKMATVDDIDELTAALAADYDLITLGADITLSNTLTIPAGKTVAIDLAGYAIQQTKECTESYSMISNSGNLTILDSVGTGRITLNDTGANSGSSWGAYTIRNDGTLIVENGTIENIAPNSTGNVNNAIFSYAGSTTIKGGTFNVPYSRSVRQWQGALTIEGGTFDGQVWVQAMSDVTTTISGGSFKPATHGNDSSSVFVTNADHNVELSVTNGTFATKLGMTVPKKCVTGGTFGAIADNIVADGYVAVKNADGTYTVIKTVDTADELKKALTKGGNIVLGDDIDLTATLMATKDVVIDLNGNTINSTASTSLFQSQSNASPNMIITSSTAGAVIDATNSTFNNGVVHCYGKTEIRNVTINAGSNKVVQVQGNGSVEIYDTVINADSGNPFNVAGDFTLGEGTVVNVTNLNSNLINNNGAHAIVIDGAKINVGTFKVNGSSMISLNQASTLKIKNTEIKIDNFVLSPFGGDSLVSKVEGVTIDGCTFDVTDSNGASCTFVAKDGKYRLVQK